MKTYQKTIVLMLLVLGGFYFFAYKIEDIQEGARNTLRAVNLLTACDETLYYSVDAVDDRFGISREEYLAIIKESENVWEKELGKNLFEYREGSAFKINLVFDDRQKQTIEKDNLDKSLDELVEDKGNLSQEYQVLYAKYKNSVVEYEKDFKKYEERLKEYNDKVKNWNLKGGVSKEEYEKLKDEQEEIEAIRIKLEKERRAINELVAKINKLANKESAIVTDYNDKVGTYREIFGDVHEFNQGEYFGTGINIYQFREKKDLILVLSHELGHALRLGHVENPESIMYYLMEKQDLGNIKLTPEDLGAIKAICRMN